MARSLSASRAKEMRTLLSRNERGEATLRELASEVGVNPSTLSWWRRRLKSDSSQSASAVPAFVEVKVAPDPVLPENSDRPPNWCSEADLRP